jgi:hypothetical protein
MPWHAILNYGPTIMQGGIDHTSAAQITMRKESLCLAADDQPGL